MPYLFEVFHEGLADPVGLCVIGGSNGFMFDAHLVEVLLQGWLGQVLHGGPPSVRKILGEECREKRELSA